MHIKRSMMVDIDDEESVTALRALGRLVWRQMQTRIPVIDRRSAPQILRDLKARFGSTPAVARALGEEPGTKGYRATLRQIERHLQGERGIGPEYRERYRKIAPPRVEERLLFRPPQAGALWFTFEGVVAYPSEPEDYEEERVLRAPFGGDWTIPEEWPWLLYDPLTSFYEGWGGNPFGGKGRFTISFKGE